jgi:hypothetical protein
MISNYYAQTVVFRNVFRNNNLFREASKPRKE